MKKKTVLIVDGASSGRELALALIRNGHHVFHMTSGAEEHYSIPEERREKYLSAMTDGVDYLKCFRYDNSMTPEENAGVLRPYGFEAVIPGTESAVYTAERISRVLGLKGNDPETSRIRRDKYCMQKALRDAGIRSIDMIVTSSCGEALGFYRKQRNGRVVIKPRESAGSEFVYLCSSEKDVSGYFEEYIGSRDFYGNINRDLLVQEYIEGTEYVANSLSRNGKHLLTDAFVYRKMTTGEGAGFFPYDRMEMLDDVRDYPVDYINAALDAVGIGFGASHMELKIDDRGPVMIEVGARLMGDICNIYYMEALGYDISEAILDAYSSDEGFEKWYGKLNGCYKPAKYYIAKTLISVLEGKLEKIPAYENLSKLETVREVDLGKTAKNGEISITKDLITSPGVVFMLGDTREDTDRDASTIHDWELNHPEKLFIVKKES